MVYSKLSLLQIYQLRITLKGINPKIFRTIVVTNATTLREFHRLIQSAFGWLDYHLYAFRDQEGTAYTNAQEGMSALESDVDDAMIKLEAVLRAKGDSLIYEYDFGDDWQHEIVVLDIGEPKAQESYPVVIDGARNCPPEDCSGTFGYGELMELAQMKQQGKPLEGEEEERMEWLGDYDPEEFDLDEANRRVTTSSKLP